MIGNAVKKLIEIVELLKTLSEKLDQVIQLLTIQNNRGG